MTPAPPPPPPPGGGCGQPAGNWASTCDGYAVDAGAGVIRSAVCTDRRGQPVTNAPFAFCPCPKSNVTNDDGELACADSSLCGPPLGSWTQTCNGFVVDEIRGTIDGASCAAPYPAPPVLNGLFSYCTECPRPVVIANNGGTLTCQ